MLVILEAPAMDTEPSVLLRGKRGTAHPLLGEGLSTGVLLLMIEILHDLIYGNRRNYGGIVNIGSCRISTINSSK